jgi:hypothetical protein
MALTLKKTVQAVKGSVKPVAKVADGFQVVSVDSIDFLSSSRGGGKPMNPATAKLIEKALTLQIGQGIKIPVAMRTEREIVNSSTGSKSILYTYQGAPSLNKRASANGMRFRTRRDVSGNLWLFAVEPYTEEQVAEREARKAAKAA